MSRVRYQIKYRRVDPEGGYPGGDQQYPHGLALQCAEVEERWPVVGLVLVLDLAFLIFQMQYRSALRMVEGRAPIERAQNKREKNYAGHRLKTQTPTNFAERRRFVTIRRINELDFESIIRNHY